MKKMFLTICLLFVGAICVKSHATKQEIVYIFMGEKARNSQKNPCKGDAITICAKKVVNVDLSEIATPKDAVEVTETIYDADGNVLYYDTTTEYGDIESVAKKIEDENIANGGIPE